MKRQFTPFKGKSQAAGLLLLILFASLVQGCSKKRETALSDEQKETIYSKADFHNKNLSVKTGPDFELFYPENEETIKRFPVVEVEDPAAAPLSKLFKGLHLEGQGGKKVTVNTVLISDYRSEKKFVAFKIVSGEELRELSQFEKFLAKNIGNNKFQIELFSYPVQQYGVLETIKNDLGENTNKLRLKETTFQQATHFVANFDVEKTFPRAPILTDDQKENLYNKADFTDRNFSIKLDSSAESFQENGETIKRYKVVDAKADGPLSKIFNDFYVEGKEDQILSVHVSLRPDNRLIAYKIVTEEEYKDLSQFEKSLAKKTEDNKYRIELFSYKVSGTGTMEVIRNDLGEPTNKLRLKETTFQDATHFTVNLGGEKMLPYSKNLADLKKYDSGKILYVDNYKNKEFLYRRTLIDSPNMFSFSFAGTSGDLEIVKFVFKEDLLEIKRSGPILAKEATSAVDEETLLAFPVSYFKMKDKDALGNTLPQPKFIEAKFDEKNIIAMVDWGMNSIPNISSPISFFGVEQCFSGARSKEISEVLAQGKGQNLAFTLATTYVSNPNLDCVEFGGYFGATQTAFTFKERLSFVSYQKDGEESEKPLLDVPYAVQKKLGFGLFTYEKVVPNKLGLTDVKGTRVPLPAIFDIRKDSKTQKFKKITYVLAGIPSQEEEPVLRKKLIEATKEVVGDLNEAFAKALKGTPMERKENVVDLQVENISAEEEELYGLTNVAPKVMGDLERNYIYYVRKGTDATIIGLGGAHNNPRSGKVEAASVFIYGGNMKTAVASYKKMIQAQKEYQKNMQLPKGVPHIIDAPPVPRPPVPPVTPPTPGPTTVETARSVPAFLKMIKTSSQDKEDLVDSIRTELQKSPKMVSYQNALGSAALEPNHKAKDIFLKFQKAVREHSDGDIHRLEAVFEGTVEEGKVVENPKAKRLAKILDRVSAAGICLYNHSLLDNVPTSAELSEDMSDEDILVSMYKPTLAHEIGHNLGLRHNFLGSYDGANHSFDTKDEEENGKKKNPRDYSSVMDYLNNDHLSYDGYGPYDVHALRAAYAGMVAVELEVPETPGPANPDKPEPNHKPVKLISLEELRKEANINSWDELRTGHLKRLKMRSFMFCSDEDVRYLPTCDRFDAGIDPVAIVQEEIDNYKSNYSLRNFPGDRLSFTPYSGSYQARILSSFIKLRQFLDEGFFLLSRGDQQEGINYLVAAYTGYKFFQEIIRMPDASSSINSPSDNSRFEVVMGINPLGQKVRRVIERKWLYDLSADANDNRELAVRGIHLDKVFALLLLTSDSLGFERYRDEKSIINYYFLEKILLPHIEPRTFKTFGVSRDNSPLLGLLGEVMLDRIEPRVTLKETVRHPVTGQVLGILPVTQDLANNFTAESTNVMKSIAAQGAALGLSQPQAMSIEDDPSSAFKVLSKTLPPDGVSFITLPKSSHGDKFWTDEDAVLTAPMIEEGAALAKLENSAPKLIEAFKAYTDLQLEAVTEERKDAHQKELLDATEAIKPLMAALPARALAPAGEPAIELDVLYAMATDMISQANQIKKLAADPVLARNLVPEKLMERNQNQFKYLARNYPVLTVFLNAIDKKHLSPEAQELRPTSFSLTRTRADIYQTAKDLSKLHYLMNFNSNK